MVARPIEIFERLDAAMLLKCGKLAACPEVEAMKPLLET
jgi:hypothetical protein